MIKFTNYFMQLIQSNTTKTKALYVQEDEIDIYTVCSRSLDLIFIVSYCINWVKTFWAYSNFVIKVLISKFLITKNNAKLIICLPFIYLSVKNNINYICLKFEVLITSTKCN